MSSMITSAVATILDRDLRALRRELEAYPDDRTVWAEPPGFPNSAGTLILHLAGNLQHYVGAVLGGTGYVRDRPAEFARRDVPRAELLDEIERARAAVRSTLERLAPDVLGREYPEAVAGARVRTGDYLIHLCAHLTYHLGQVDVQRRVMTGSGGGIGAVQAAEIARAEHAPV
jgi:uncharacterized damage-inducible protein DinB